MVSRTDFLLGFLIGTMLIVIAILLKRQDNDGGVSVVSPRPFIPIDPITSDRN